MKYKYISLFFTLLISTVVISCNANSKPTQNQDSTELRNNSLTVTINRLDSDIYSYVQNPSKEKQQQLIVKYNDLLEAFGSTVINRSDINHDNFYNKLHEYFSNNLLWKIYTDEQHKFSDISSYQNDLGKVNFRIAQYFEGKTLPTLDLHVSGFKENVVVTDSVISISADKYLGADYVAYNRFFEKYQLIQMQPQMITRDFIKAWLINELPKSTDRKNLLSEIIDQGKILFALEELLPDWNESDLIGYTQDQLDWSFKNEKNIWNKTIQNKYLFSTDFQTINRYIEDAPYTSTIGTESPGYLGRWIGWQIVRAYAKNTGASLSDIINQNNSQLILKESKYNP